MAELISCKPAAHVLSSFCVYFGESSLQGSVSQITEAVAARQGGESTAADAGSWADATSCAHRGFH